MPCTPYSQLHSRIAFMPVAGGTSVPSIAPATLPGYLYAVQRSTTTTASLTRRPVGASGAPTGPAEVVDTSTLWAAARGAFLAGNTLYYGTAAGLSARSFDAGTLGDVRQVNLYDDPDDGRRIPFPTGNLTGMFYDTSLHRIYYTVAGDARLYYRYFTPESEVVGAQTFVATAGSVNFSTTAGLTLAGGAIYFGSSADGRLRSAPFAAGRVSGAATIVGTDTTWNTRGLFVAGP